MHTVPTCPSCGYDLTGATSGWIASCPLEGSCPECGHTLRWSEILGRNRLAAPLFDYARRRPSLHSFLESILGVCLSRNFWTRARAQRPAARWRLLLLATLGPLLTHAIVGALLTVLALLIYFIDHNLFEDWTAVDDYIAMAAWPYADWYEEYIELLFAPAIAACIFFMLMPCFSLLLFPSARAGGALRANDLARAAAHVLIILPLVVAPWGILSIVNVGAWSLYYYLPSGLDFHGELLASGLGTAKIVVLGLWTLLCFAWFWRGFLARYLDVKRPTLTVLLIGSINILLTFILLLALIIFLIYTEML